MKLLSWTRLALGLGALQVAALSGQANAGEATPFRNIFLTEARDIADAKAVNDALEIVVSDAAACRRSGRGATACACSNAGIGGLRSAFDAAMTRHPSWNVGETVVNFRTPTSGGAVALSFSGLARQLEVCSRR